MPRAFKLIAEHPALDLANTLDDRYHPRGPVELIESYADFVRFCVQAHVLRETHARDLRARVDQASGERALRTVRTVRDVIERIFSALATGRRIASRDLAALNRQLAEASRHRTIGARAGALGWSWDGLTRDALGPLWPIVFAAAELLASDARQYVRQCGCVTCRWLFVDTSKNHSRRWCDMKICGDRMKARAYYRRHTGRTGQAGSRSMSSR
jgi:predicted RNA-binding Zn ribbon-like protein